MPRHGERSSEDRLWWALDRLSERKGKLSASKRISAAARIRSSFNLQDYQKLLADNEIEKKARRILCRSLRDSHPGIAYQSCLIIGHFSAFPGRDEALSVYFATVISTLDSESPSNRLLSSLQVLQYCLEKIEEKSIARISDPSFFNKSPGKAFYRGDNPLEKIIQKVEELLEYCVEMNVVTAVVRVVAALEKRWPVGFAPHFSNVVDILLGWGLDPETPERTRREMINCMQELNWIRRENLANSIINKLISHLSHALQSLNLSSTNKYKSNQNIETRKVVAKVAHLTSSIHAISHGLMQAASEISEIESISIKSFETLARLYLKAMEINQASLSTESYQLWLCSCNNSLATILKLQVGAIIRQHSKDFADFLDAQIESFTDSKEKLKDLPAPLALSIINLLETLIPHLSSSSLESACKILKLSMFQKLRVHEMKQVVKGLRKVYVAILRRFDETEDRKKTDAHWNILSGFFDYILAEVSTMSEKKKIEDKGNKKHIAFFLGCISSLDSFLARSPMKKLAEIIPTLIAILVPNSFQPPEGTNPDSHVDISTRQLITYPELQFLSFRILNNLAKNTSHIFWQRSPSSESADSILSAHIVPSQLDLVLTVLLVPISTNLGGLESNTSKAVILRQISLSWLRRLLSFPGRSVQEYVLHSPAYLHLIVSLSAYILRTDSNPSLRAEAAKLCRLLCKLCVQQVSRSYAQNTRQMAGYFEAGVLLAHALCESQVDPDESVRNLSGITSSSLSPFLPSDYLLLRKLRRKAAEVVQRALRARNRNNHEDEVSRIPKLLRNARGLHPRLVALVSGRQGIAIDEIGGLITSMYALPAVRTFRSEQFNRIFNFLAKNVKGVVDSNTAAGLLHFAHPAKEEKVEYNCEQLRNAAMLDQAFHHTWLSSEVAKYMILNHLKTPLGGPMKSLSIFEKLLAHSQVALQIAHEGMPEEKLERHRGAAILIGTFLLELTEVIEKLILNTTDGTKDVPGSKKSVSKFFKANSRVVASLFARSRIQAVGVAGRIGLPEALQDHGPVLLKYLLAHVKGNEEVKAKGKTDSEKLLKTAQQRMRLLKVFATSKSLVLRGLLRLHQVDAMSEIGKLVPRSIEDGKISVNVSPSSPIIAVFRPLTSFLQSLVLPKEDIKKFPNTTAHRFDMSSLHEVEWPDAMILHGQGRIEDATWSYAVASLRYLRKLVQLFSTATSSEQEARQSLSLHKNAEIEEAKCTLLRDACASMQGLEESLSTANDWSILYALVDARNIASKAYRTKVSEGKLFSAQVEQCLKDLLFTGSDLIPHARALQAFDKALASAEKEDAKSLMMDTGNKKLFVDAIADLESYLDTRTNGCQSVWGDLHDAGVKKSHALILLFIAQSRISDTIFQRTHDKILPRARDLLNRNHSLYLSPGVSHTPSRISTAVMSSCLCAAREDDLTILAALIDPPNSYVIHPGPLNMKDILSVVRTYRALRLLRKNTETDIQASKSALQQLLLSSVGILREKRNLKSARKILELVQLVSSETAPKIAPASSRVKIAHDCESILLKLESKMNALEKLPKATDKVSKAVSITGEACNSLWKLHFAYRSNTEDVKESLMKLHLHLLHVLRSKSISGQSNYSSQKRLFLEQGYNVEFLVSGCTGYNAKSWRAYADWCLQTAKRTDLVSKSEKGIIEGKGLKDGLKISKKKIDKGMNGEDKKGPPEGKKAKRNTLDSSRRLRHCQGGSVWICNESLRNELQKRISIDAKLKLSCLALSIANETSKNAMEAGTANETSMSEAILEILKLLSAWIRDVIGLWFKPHESYFLHSYAISEESSLVPKPTAENLEIAGDFSRKACLRNLEKWFLTKLTALVSLSSEETSGLLKPYSSPLHFALDAGMISLPSALQSLAGAAAEVGLLHIRFVADLHRAAANGLCRQLVLCGTGRGKQQDAYGEGEGEHHAILACLRLLDLLTSPARPLSSHNRAQIVETTPTGPWRLVIPQLLARLLTHGRPEIRRRIDCLLKRVSRDFPGHALFPALAELEHLPNTEASNGPTEIKNRINEEATNSPRVLAQRLQLQRIVSSASPRSAELACRLVGGLNSIVSLPEDRWLFFLRQLMGDLPWREKLLRDHQALQLQAASDTKKQVNGEDSGTRGHYKKQKWQKVKEENTKLKSVPQDQFAATHMYNTYQTIMHPIILQIQQLAKDTLSTDDSCVRANVSPHQRAFKAKYGETILHLVKIISEPKSIRNISRHFSQMRQEASKLKQDLDSVQVVDLRQVSLSLASWADREATNNISANCDEIEGLTFAGMDNATVIADFRPKVRILATKTRPKKIEMMGTDGNIYRYLLKSQEDLRLDQRIMQLLRVMNGILATRNMQSTSSYGENLLPSPPGLLRACTYHVVPLSHRSGILQWVDNVEPLFDYYKRWQRREMNRAAESKTQTKIPTFTILSSNDSKTKQQEKKKSTQIESENSKRNASISRDSTTSESEEAQPVPAPVEEFARAIQVRLRANGMNANNKNRHEWPLAVLRGAFVDLMSRTPSDLISRELWLASRSIAGHWTRRQRFGASVAVMSILGWLVGLGDRHLGNILLARDTGEILHIDYGVIFGAGLRLPVPEIVPFRLTHTLINALGPLGVAGRFRGCCMSVRQCTSFGNEELITGLIKHAFVYSPLATWTRDVTRQSEERQWREERRELDGNVALTLLSSAITSGGRLTIEVKRLERDMPACLEKLSKSFSQLSDLVGAEPHALTNTSKALKKNKLMTKEERIRLHQREISTLQRRISSLTTSLDRLIPSVREHGSRLLASRARCEAWLTSSYSTLEAICYVDRIWLLGAKQMFSVSMQDTQVTATTQPVLNRILTLSNFLAKVPSPSFPIGHTFSRIISDCRPLLISMANDTSRCIEALLRYRQVVVGISSIVDVKFRDNSFSREYNLNQNSLSSGLSWPSKAQLLSYLASTPSNEHIKFVDTVNPDIKVTRNDALILTEEKAHIWLKSVWQRASLAHRELLAMTGADESFNTHIINRKDELNDSAISSTTPKILFEEREAVCIWNFVHGRTQQTTTHKNLVNGDSKITKTSKFIIKVIAAKKLLDGKMSLSSSKEIQSTYHRLLSLCENFLARLSTGKSTLVKALVNYIWLTPKQRDSKQQLQTQINRNFPSLCRFGPPSANLRQALDFLQGVCGRSGILIDKIQSFVEQSDSISVVPNTKKKYRKKAKQKKKIYISQKDFDETCRRLISLREKFHTFVSTPVTLKNIEEVSDEKLQLFVLHQVMAQVNNVLASLEHDYCASITYAEMKESKGVKDSDERGDLMKGLTSLLPETMVKRRQPKRIYENACIEFLRLFFIKKVSLSLSLARSIFFPSVTSNPWSAINCVDDFVDEIFVNVEQSVVRFSRGRNCAPKVSESVTKEWNLCYVSAERYVLKQQSILKRELNKAYLLSCLQSSHLESELASWLIEDNKSRKSSDMKNENTISNDVFFPASFISLNSDGKRKLTCRRETINILEKCTFAMGEQQKVLVGILNTQLLPNLLKMEAEIIAPAQAQLLRGGANADGGYVMTLQQMILGIRESIRIALQDHTKLWQLARGAVEIEKERDTFYKHNSSDKEIASPFVKDCGKFRLDYLSILRKQWKLRYSMAETRIALTRASKKIEELNGGDVLTNRRQRKSAWSKKPELERKAARLREEVKTIASTTLKAHVEMERGWLTQLRQLFSLAVRGRKAFVHNFRSDADKLHQSLEKIVSEPTLANWRAHGGNDGSLQKLQKSVYERLQKIGRDQESHSDELDIRKAPRDEKEHEDGSLPLIWQEQHNKFAVEIVKKVQMKLSVNSQSGIKRQVEKLIREATSIDNLSRMYEGWAPWI